MGDLGLELRDASRLLVLGEAHKLDVTAEDLGLAEVLGHPEQGGQERFLAALVLATVLREEVEPQDLVEATLQVECGRPERLAITHARTSSTRKSRSSRAARRRSSVASSWLSRASRSAFSD